MEEPADVRSSRPPGEPARPAWAPDIAKAAPMPLLGVQAFVNSYESDSDTDLFRGREQTVRWLVEAGLLGPEQAASIDAGDLAALQAVREAIRAMLQGNAGIGAPSADQCRLLQQLADQATLRVRVDGGGSGVTVEAAASSAVAAVAARLFLLIRDAQLDGSWYRLKACNNEECGWAFYDRSHSRRGRWCDMAVCGNRVKNRALRARRR